jgi:hypothetical protein
MFRSAGMGGQGNGGAVSTDVTLRVARPTDRLDDVVRFYSVGLGLSVLESFQDHEGFDGTMLGRPGAPYHLAFNPYWDRSGRTFEDPDGYRVVLQNAPYP